jgi:exodeoxyribonuclease VIII
MLDLETMGTGANAPIIAIGAVKFDHRGIIEPFYYSHTSLQSCVDLGMTMDPGTVMWWMKQNDEARAAITKDNPTHIVAALQSFAEWCGRPAGVWGNGASFDNVLLANAFKLAGIRQPWSYKADRCYRTVRALFPDINPPRNERLVLHNALDDARWQTHVLLEIIKSGAFVL